MHWTMVFTRLVPCQPYVCIVIDLSIVDQGQVWEPWQFHGLHTRLVIHYGQLVEAQTTILIMDDVLHAEGIWSSVGDLHEGLEVRRHAIITPKQGPDSTHGC